MEFLTGQPLFRQIIFDVRILFNAILSVAELPPNFDQNSFLTKNKFVTLPKLPIKRKPIVSRISAANFPRNDGTDDDENHNGFFFISKSKKIVVYSQKWHNFAEKFATIDARKSVECFTSTSIAIFAA